MIQIKVNKGYSPRITGRLTSKLHRAGKPEKVALLPEKIPFIKPRLLLKKGDRIKKGTPLIEDRRNPDIRFLSPGGGRIEAVNLGPRRVIREVVIELDREEEEETFDRLGYGDIDRIKREELVAMIIRGGLWPLFKELPFRDYPSPGTVPPGIIVNLEKPETHSPMPEVYLSGHSDLLLYGLKIAAKLAEKIFVFTNRSEKRLSGDISRMITHRVTGAYPAADPGVLLYHTKKTARENHSWYIYAQDLLLLAALFKEGVYPVERVFAVSGSASSYQGHVFSRAGAPLSHISAKRAESGRVTHIVGGLFNGYALPSDSYMGFFETSLSLLPPGDDEEFFGFMRPGFKKPSHSRTFLSYFNRSPLDADCGMHGDARPCVNCGKCAAVCPVDILPQFTFKCMVADEIEEALAHGLLDCVECGLCSYVCPSKVELAHTFINAKAQYHKEHAE